MLSWLIIVAVLLAVETVSIVVLWQQTRLTRRTTERVVDIHERLDELERTAMRKGWPYVQEAGGDPYVFVQPRHGEDQGEGA